MTLVRRWLRPVTLLLVAGPTLAVGPTPQSGRSTQIWPTPDFTTNF